MKKNYIIAFILIFLVMAGGVFLQKMLTPPVPENASPAEQQPVVQTQQNGNQGAVVLSDAELNKLEAEQAANTTATAGTATTTAQAGSDAMQTATLADEKTYIVETDIVRATFTNKGGDIISFKLKEHNIAGSTENVEMIENVTDTNRALSISLGQYASGAVNTIMTCDEQTGDAGEKIISFTGIIALKNARGEIEKLKLSKHYRFFPGEYLFELVVTIDGLENFSPLNYGGIAYTICTAPQIGPDWNKKDRYDFRRFISYVNGKRKDTTLKAGGIKEGPAEVSWVAVSGKYFTFALIPDKTAARITYSSDTANAQFATENTQAFVSMPAMPSNSLQNSYKVYLGPTGEKYLNRYSNATKNKLGIAHLGLDSLASSNGFLAPVIVILKYLLQWTYLLVHNWGIAIIIVTILIKLVLLPLSIKSMVGTQKLQPYQAAISDIQRKYKTNPQKMQEELSKVYTKAGYQPGCVTGCLPLLIQFAVIIAMFQLFNNYFEFRGANFISGWISDLSIGDTVHTLKKPIPLLGWSEIRLLPLIYVATQYVSTLLTRQMPQPQQTQTMMFFMMYIMPAFFFFILYDAPSGLFVHWIVSNILMIFQQFLTNSIVKKEMAKTQK